MDAKTKTEIVVTAQKIIFGQEGNYGSVNANDNGAVSVGKVQWHAGRALALLKKICAAESKAASILGDLLKMQTEPIMIVAALGSQLRRIWTARLALDSGKDRYWLMELWGMKSDYPAKLLLDNARRVSRSWCARGVRRCYEVDLRIKSVSGVDGADELKLLLMELAQRD